MTDTANRDYYEHEMVVRRVRLVTEVDVEWREDDPTYCLAVAKVDGLPETSVRLLNPVLVSAEMVDDEARQVIDGR